MCVRFKQELSRAYQLFDVEKKKKNSIAKKKIKQSVRRGTAVRHNNREETLNNNID